jgi:hypothetical protein
MPRNGSERPAQCDERPWKTAGPFVILVVDQLDVGRAVIAAGTLEAMPGRGKQAVPVIPAREDARAEVDS